MDFDEALNAHAQWKLRLLTFINGASKEPLDPKVVGRDDQCGLGKWIHGEAKVHSALPEYAQLVEIHARFHKAAATVLNSHLSGKTPQAKAMLDPGGAFHEAAMETLIGIRHLRDKVK